VIGDGASGFDLDDGEEDVDVGRLKDEINLDKFSGVGLG
jgi:hypothetical protein